MSKSFITLRPQTRLPDNVECNLNEYSDGYMDGCNVTMRLRFISLRSSTLSSNSVLWSPSCMNTTRGNRPRAVAMKLVKLSCFNVCRRGAGMSDLFHVTVDKG